MSEQALERAMPWLVIVGALIVWEASCVVFEVPAFILPRPTLVWAKLVQFREAILFHSWHTLYTTMIGFLIAIALGLAIGLAIGASRLVYNGFYPLLIGFNSVPKVAVVPILILWFGVGTIPAIITACIISFFPIVVNVATGLATIEPEMRDVLRSLGATRGEVLVKVGIPRAMPYLFASLKVSITLAFVGSVLSEAMGSNEGIGAMMQIAASQFDAALTFAGLFVIAAMGIVMYVVCLVFERRMTGWAFRGELVT